MNDEIEKLLYGNGVDAIRFIDISCLPAEQTQGFSKAAIFLIALSKEFILSMRDELFAEQDDFVLKEQKADSLADELAEYIRKKGYNAYSQSEKNNIENKNFNHKNKTAVLPHKTLACLAGLGFIGKNDLLITEEYGCGFCMCTVLTNAPLETRNYPLIIKNCGNCEICRDICPAKAIHGKQWSEVVHRDEMVDVYKCNCALKCMVNCPYTLRYALSE